MFSQYGESQVFTGYEEVLKEYANATVSSNFRYTYTEDISLSTTQKATITSAVSKGLESVEIDGITYTISDIDDNFKRISILSDFARVTVLKGIYTFDETGKEDITEEDRIKIKEAISTEEAFVEIQDTEYMILKVGKYYAISESIDIAYASRYVFDFYNSSTEDSYEFRLAAQTAVAEEKDHFESEGLEYSLVNDGGVHTVYLNQEPYVNITKMVIQSSAADGFLSVAFKTALQQAVEQGEKEFKLTEEDGSEAVYQISGNNGSYVVKALTKTQLIKIYEAPSTSHLLGTDANGMDIMTRLMYGGRISLLIGFIVVIIETLLGIILGGIAGYFGGWIDNLIMRIVDIFNCIPALPLYIILGSIMEALKVDPQVRIYYLMFILGLLSWLSIARLVRGQILSLREQEFMIAAEATGISVRRRIFKHLIPNVIPQLIVMATMGLGSIIITESTLSFLGLGVKYPYASWGNIINAVTSLRVMTSYWFVWIPAGFLILITVLGFNFIGDGLRDAFDPR